MTQAALGARHGSHGKGCGGAPVTVLFNRASLIVRLYVTIECAIYRW
jgi:hypothetical protein